MKVKDAKILINDGNFFTFDLYIMTSLNECTIFFYCVLQLFLMVLIMYILLIFISNKKPWYALMCINLFNRYICVRLQSKYRTVGMDKFILKWTIHIWSFLIIFYTLTRNRKIPAETCSSVLIYLFPTPFLVPWLEQ